MPVRYSIKVPLLIGISISARYFIQKLMNFLRQSSDKCVFRDYIFRLIFYLSANFLISLIGNQSILRKKVVTCFNWCTTYLIPNFLLITPSDQSNVRVLFQLSQTVNHRLLDFLNIKVKRIHFLVWLEFHQYQIDK
jgi:hypothetical protein